MQRADLWRKQQYGLLTMSRKFGQAIDAIGGRAGSAFTDAVTAATQITRDRLEMDAGDLPWLRGPSFQQDGNSTSNSQPDPARLFASSREFQPGYVPSTASLWGCVPPNPVLGALSQHAELNLNKIRSCRNIAGMKREIEPYAAPTTAVDPMPMLSAAGQLVIPNIGFLAVQPTLYRYQTLVDRAKQLAQMASQMEAAMLSALEKLDDRAYGVLKARQDLSLTQATVQLQALKMSEANDRVALARLQKQRADDQASYFQGLLDDTTSQAYQEEQDALRLLTDAVNANTNAVGLNDQAASAYGVATVGGGIEGAATFAMAGAAVGSFFGPAGTVAGAIGGGIAGAIFGSSGPNAAGYSANAAAASSRAAASSIQATRMSTLAAYERRRDDWQYQLNLAHRDSQIGAEQVNIANDDLSIATQEKGIADLQNRNAEDVHQFLSHAFTNPDLYDWISGVLERVYSFFLRQAAAVAKLAENQLAFERQEIPPGFIQPDYWAPAADLQSSGGGTAPDRKGLTGAERLLQDITQLDQYAFVTDTRKLQLSKTFSLGRVAPAEFERFRQTGVLTFSTPMEIFDRDFPGHYLRLIKRVRVSLIALISPNQGICATLSSSGFSRVVIGGDSFQTVAVRREPESVALSSPVAASGMLDLTPQTDNMLLPFEDTGVDTSWEFRLERASNLFDYSTIGDVLMTVDYTALSSSDYRQKVIQSLGTDITADRPFSFRNQFMDQWYDLNNPDQSPTPMTVKFSTIAADYPPNIEDVTIAQVLLYVARTAGQNFEVPVSLKFTPEGAAAPMGGAATTIDGVISTRRGNAGSWTQMQGRGPAGEWELALPNSDEMKTRFQNGDIQDILFVITYKGVTADWAA
jgi:hypothetical protein